MRYLLLLGALLALIVASGCAYSMVVEGQQGKAFVVKSTPFGSTFWNCEASGGKPKCYKVIKQ
jgi:hypothetical protein